MTSTITKTEHGLSINGNLTFDSVNVLLDQGVQLIEQSNNSNKNEFVIDCNDMQRIDSAGIALLMKWKKEINKLKQTCQFAGLSNQAKSLIQAYRLESLITA